MPGFDRVRLANGSHASIPHAVAVAAGLKPLKRPALARDGSPLPTKHRVLNGSAGVADNPTTEAADASESKED